MLRGLGAGLSPLKVVQEVRQLCSELHVVVGEDELSLEAKRNATLLFHVFLRATLASKRVLAEYRLSEDAFEYLIGEIKTRFNEVCPFSRGALHCWASSPCVWCAVHA